MPDSSDSAPAQPASSSDRANVLGSTVTSNGGHIPVKVELNLSQLLKMRNQGTNGDEKNTQLAGFLTTLSQGIPSFSQLDMEVVNIEPTAKELIKHKVLDLKGLLNTTLFDAKGSWKPEAEPALREMAVYFKNHLKSMRETLIKADNAPPKSRSPSQDRAPKRKRKRDNSSSSSTSERRDQQDKVTHHLNNSEFKMFGTASFPDSKLVLKVFKHRQKNNNSVAFLASSSLEDWVPSYVGQELPSAQRKALRADRTKTDSLTLAQALEHITAFWITHGLAGSVSKDAVFKCILTCVRIANGHSVKWLVLYFRNLVAHIRSEITDKSITSFNSYINQIIPEVETQTNLHFSRLTGRPHQPGIGGNTLPLRNNFNRNQSRPRPKAPVTLRPNPGQASQNTQNPNRAIGLTPPQTASATSQMCRFRGDPIRPRNSTPNEQVSSTLPLYPVPPKKHFRQYRTPPNF